MGAIFQKGSSVICPHCGEEQDYTVESCFGSEEIEIDSEEEDECWFCAEGFTIVSLGDDEFEIVKAGEDAGDRDSDDVPDFYEDEE